MASLSAAAQVATPAFDLEQGDGHASGLEDEISARYYCYVYSFSLFIVVVSIWAFLFPFSNGRLVGNVVGPCGVVIGAFLILNTDLLVTYLRLLQETMRFEETNGQYTDSLIKQKARMRELKGIQKALRTFDHTLHENLGRSEEELAELHANARDSVRQNIAGVFAITSAKRQEIQAGKDLQTVLEVFSSSYIHVFPTIDRRYEEMMKGLEASFRWQAMQSLSTNRLKSILVVAFFEDIGDIEDIVRRKVDASSDAVASSFLEEDEDLSWTLKYEKTAPDLGNASAVPKSDSWAEAVAFAGVQQKQKGPDVKKKDSWAEAMEFAGVDG